MYFMLLFMYNCIDFNRIYDRIFLKAFKIINGLLFFFNLSTILENLDHTKYMKNMTQCQHLSKIIEISQNPQTPDCKVVK